jgi:hypothetical protein
MFFLDAIDKLLEPITKRIFATELGKNIKPLSGDDFFTDTDLNNDPSCDCIPGNIYYHDNN